ncbi:MAG: AtpZ/AtpI family protein [Bacteroidota bacterium]
MTDPKKNPKSFLQYSSLGFQIIGFMASFGYLGYSLDEYFSLRTPILTMSGLLFGVVGAMIYLIRSLTKNNE